MFVHEGATTAGLDDACIWDLMLATSEAVANAVQHGKAWPNGSILVTTEPCPRGLRVEVTDCGSFDSTIEPTPLESESGRGLPIIAAVVDLLEVRNRDGRTLVSFERHCGHELSRHDMWRYARSASARSRFSRSRWSGARSRSWLCRARRARTVSCPASCRRL